MSDIKISNLNKSFGDKTVLRNLRAVFPCGRITCIMGSSGCGKTTLLNILMGLMSADSGEITGIPGRVSAVFQEDRLCEGFTAVSNIRAVTGKNVPIAEIEKHLTDLGLADSMYKPVIKLSGGMKRRVAIARAILYDPELIILDEAFKGLDAATKKLAMDYLLKHVSDNVDKGTGVLSTQADTGAGICRTRVSRTEVSSPKVDKNTGAMGAEVSSTQAVNSSVPLSNLSKPAKTVIAVTHDFEEAEYLGGSIIRLE